MRFSGRSIIYLSLYTCFSRLPETHWYIADPLTTTTTITTTTTSRAGQEFVLWPVVPLLQQTDATPLLPDMTLLNSTNSLHSTRSSYLPILRASLSLSLSKTLPTTSLPPTSHLLSLPLSSTPLPYGGEPNRDHLASFQLP